MEHIVIIRQMSIKNRMRGLVRLLDKEIGLQKKLKDYLELCPFTERCSESNFGDEEICKNDYETCKRYKRIKKEDASKYLERIK